MLRFFTNSEDLAYLRFRRLLLAQKIEDARGSIRTVVLTSLGSLFVMGVLLVVTFA